MVRSPIHHYMLSGILCEVFVPSKDGTKVPMFITHKKGLKLDGSNPTLLYGYGELVVDAYAGAVVPSL